MRQPVMHGPSKIGLQMDSELCAGKRVSDRPGHAFVAHSRRQTEPRPARRERDACMRDTVNLTQWRLLINLFREHVQTFAQINSS